MNKFIVFFFIVIFIISTTLVCIFKPKTHKPIVFENRIFKLSMMTNSAEAETSATKIITVDLNNSEKAEKIQNVEKIDKKYSQKTQNVSKTIAQKPSVATKTTNSVKLSKSTVSQKSENKSLKNKNNVEPSKTNQTVKKEQNTTVEKPKKEEVQQKQPEQKTEKVLTEEEEIIAWNKWRSDLQNKLMKDSKISAPIGTSFMFSFTVDKYGNVSNLKTWSNNSSYTPLAVRVLKPILLGYQKTAVLEFPTGSKRIITNAEGGFTMAYSSRYASPSDYNDYERVQK